MTVLIAASIRLLTSSFATLEDVTYVWISTFNPESQLLDTCPVTSELGNRGRIMYISLLFARVAYIIVYTTSMMINTQTMMIDEDALNG